MATTTSKSERVEIITSIQRRRRWSPSEKQSKVQETYEPGATVSYVARKHGICPSQLFYWRRRMEEGALTGVACEEKVVPESELKKAHDRIRRLENILGPKT